MIRSLVAGILFLAILGGCHVHCQPCEVGPVYTLESVRRTFVEVTSSNTADGTLNTSEVKIAPIVGARAPMLLSAIELAVGRSMYGIDENQRFLQGDKLSVTTRPRRVGDRFIEHRIIANINQ